MKHILPLLLFVMLSCSGPDNKKATPPGERKDLNAAPQENTGGEKTSSPSAITGEWYQQSAVLDQNGNGILDPVERNGISTSLGFNYFQFNEDGSCLYDSDMKFKGKYRLLEEKGKTTLQVTVNGFGETYSYTLAEPVQSELVLYASGAFMLFKRK